MAGKCWWIPQSKSASNGDWKQGLKNTNPFMASRALARIHAVSLLTRSDKRKDRVEIAPEQLHLAACAAEVPIPLILGLVCRYKPYMRYY